MYTMTLTKGGDINEPLELEEFFAVKTISLSGLFVDLSNAVIERFVLQDPSRFDTMIHSLHSNEFELKVSMPVTLELVDDDEAVATFPKENIAISGDSPAHAIEELRHHLVGLYKVFKREQDNLGPMPKAQLKEMEAYIGETEKNLG